jgi:hypothetical protein
MLLVIKMFLRKPLTCKIKNKTFIVALCLVSLISSVRAQKLPGTQPDGMLVDHILVDGQSSDWPAPFKAYNKSTDVYYSIGNNKKFLYIIIRATDPLIIKKILNGGITLTINPGKKEFDEDMLSLSFPFFRTSEEPSFDYTYEPEIPADSSAKRHFMDSLNNKLNQQFKSKEIEVKGLHGIKDSVISIYNESGIQAGAAFNGNHSYTVEFGVLLDHFLKTGAAIETINYNIKLPAFRTVKLMKGALRPPPPPPVPMKDRTLFSATDFWANYTLKL